MRLCLVGLLSLPVLAFAWNEPDGFRGLLWGSTEGQVRQAEGYRYCLDVANRQIADRLCMLKFELSGVEVRAGLFLRYATGLREVHLAFDPDRFEAVRDVFLERYGAPTGRRSSRVRNTHGMERENEELEWQGSIGYVALRKYNPKDGRLALSEAYIGAAVQGPALEPDRDAARDMVRRQAGGL
jgi:hypothetical protein